MKNISAFTLSEVLITLGVIGIVAAMTLPSLIGRWQEKVTVAKLEHAYSLLSQAYVKAIGEDGDARYLNCSSADCFMKKLAKNLSVLSLNYEDTPEFSALNGDISYNSSVKRMYRMVLENGYIIYYREGFSQTCTMTYSTWDVDELYKTICMSLKVDINGDAKPNTFGRDIFSFYLVRDRIIPYGGVKEPYYKFNWLCNKSRPDYWDGGYNGEFCTAWVLYNKNMDYLYCNDLNWKGKTKCK